VAVWRKEIIEFLEKYEILSQLFPRICGWLMGKININEYAILVMEWKVNCDYCWGVRTICNRCKKSENKWISLQKVCFSSDWSCIKSGIFFCWVAKSPEIFFVELQKVRNFFLLSCKKSGMADFRCKKSDFRCKKSCYPVDGLWRFFFSGWWVDDGIKLLIA